MELTPAANTVANVVAKMVGLDEQLDNMAQTLGIPVPELMAILLTPDAQDKLRELIKLKVLVSSGHILESSIRAASLAEGFNDRKMLLSMAGMTTAKSEVEGGDKPITVVEIIMSKGASEEEGA